MLDRFSELAAEIPARLIFLGDLINRGPSSLKALSLWASAALDAHFTKVHRGALLRAPLVARRGSR